MKEQSEGRGGRSNDGPKNPDNVMPLCDPQFHRDNRSEVRDGRGIFLTYVCPRCREDKLATYRPEIFSGQYDADDLGDDEDLNGGDSGPGHHFLEF